MISSWFATRMSRSSKVSSFDVTSCTFHFTFGTFSLSWATWCDCNFSDHAFHLTPTLAWNNWRPNVNVASLQVLTSIESSLFNFYFRNFGLSLWKSFSTFQFFCIRSQVMPPSSFLKSLNCCACLQFKYMGKCILWCPFFVSWCKNSWPSNYMMFLKFKFLI
jgi:hypothetical protein